MKVLVSGSSGLIGSAVIPALEAGGHGVVRLVREAADTGDDAVLWSPRSGQVDMAALERAACDSVLHLAGESVSAGRWTPERKEAIRDSRVKGTRLLADALARLSRPPQVLLCASAIGYYGDRGAEVLTEESGPGVDFLAGVCRD